MIIYSLGFIFCLGLLFYFIAKYKESGASPKIDNDWSLTLEEDKTKESIPDVGRLVKSETMPVREIVDLKDKIKDYQYSLEEMRLLEDKHYTELKKILDSLENRIATFENEYVNKLQPMLTTLISELETIQNKQN